MALTIEDGSVVADADSLIDTADFRAYAVSRGVNDLSTDDEVVDALLRKAMDFINAQRSRFQGVKVDEGQSLQWPRSGVYVDGFPVAADSIHPDLINAQCELAIALHNGVDLQPNENGREVIRKKLDVIETQWSAKGVTAVPILRAAEALLEPFYKVATGGLTTIRV